MRQILADNIAALMARSKFTQAVVAGKAGIAQTSVSQMLRPDNEAAKSPKLDQVEKVAHAFGISAWQLLLDPKTVGKELSELLMRPSPSDESAAQGRPSSDRSEKEKSEYKLPTPRAEQQPRRTRRKRQA